jgi:alpha-tubulin suppressor-like RCC1 family protein
VLTTSGSVWTFGQNDKGQLGYEKNVRNNAKPMQIDLENITSVWCGGKASYIQDHQGRMFVFGSNDYGQLGFPKEQQICIEFPCENPLLCNRFAIPGGDHLVTVDAEGNVEFFGAINDMNEPIEQCLNINITPKEVKPLKSAASIHK